MSVQSFQFGVFTLDLARMGLLGPAGPIELRPKTFDVLKLLVSRAGQLVSKDELMAAVWADVNVTEDSLTKCISELRRALDDDSHSLIKTVSKRGYRLDAQVKATGGLAPVPVAEAESLAASDDASSHAVTAGHRHPFQRSAGPGRLHRVGAFGLILMAASLAWPFALPGMRAVPGTSPEMRMMATPTVAVLPFRVLGDGDRSATLAAALTVETRAELARAPRGFPLAITAWPAVSPASSMPAPGDVPGDVRYVVRGTTWMEAGVRRVNVQLIEKATSREIWSESFSETSGDAHAINLVATRIGRLLGLQIRAAEAMRPLPSHPEAGHYALLGRALFESERGIKETAEALDLFKKALQLDPRSIAALQGIAKSKLIQVQNGMLPVAERRDALEQANAAIEEIIRIDRRNVAGHYLRGSLLRARGEPDLAIAAFEQALSLNPNYASAHAEIGRVKIDLGRSEEAIAHLRHAIRLSPTDPVIYAWYFWAGMAAVHLDDRTAALHWLLKARQANRNFAHTLQLMAVTYQRAGDHQRAEAAMREFLATLPGFTLEAWRRGMATRDPVAARQRQAIEDDLRRLGVPEHRHAVARR